MAHPDDPELSSGGTIAQWTKEGNVHYIIVSCGEKGTWDRNASPFMIAETREKEARSAARFLGVKKVIFLRRPDGAVDAEGCLKIELADYGSYLGRDAGCFELKTKDGNVEHYPHFEKEIGECVLKSGSYVSVDALIDLMLWNIDTYIMTRHNRVVGFLKNVEDDAHVKTRVAQYQALENGRGLKIAKEIVKAKIEGQNMILRKYDLKAIDRNVGDVSRRKLLSIESQHARHYFNQIFKLFPEHLRPERRTGYKAYDGINIKLMKAGGLQEAMRMIHLAKAFNMKIMLGCMIESSVAISAGAQLSPMVDWADLDGNLLISNDPFSGVTVEQGKLVLNDKPGLGVEGDF